MFAVFLDQNQNTNRSKHLKIVGNLKRSRIMDPQSSKLIGRQLGSYLTNS